MTTTSLSNQAAGDAIEACNRLLLEEMRIVGQYGGAIHAVPRPDMTEGLLKVQYAHERAAGLLRTSLLELGCLSCEAMDIWSDAPAVEVEREDSGKWEHCDLSAMQACEGDCFTRYASLLRRADVPHACRELIRMELLPLPPRNIEILRSVAAIRNLAFSRSPFGQNDW